MKTSRHSLLTLLAGAMMLTATVTSCESHDTFCFDHYGAVTVEYDWSEAPDASEISGTRVNFYRTTDGTLAASANFSGLKGGTIHLDRGTYDVIAYNNNTDQVHWRGESHITTLEGYTRQATLTEDLPGFSYEPIPDLVLYPNRLWRARLGELTVTNKDTVTITLTPQKATYEVIWSVSGVRAAKRANAFAISLSGLGGSLMLGDLTTARNNSLMASAGTLNTVDAKGIGLISGTLEIFGCPQDELCNHTLTLYCWANGGNIRASYPIASQFHVVADDRKIYLHIQADIEIPAGGGDSGFIPGVDNWDSIDEDIIL